MDREYVANKLKNFLKVEDIEKHFGSVDATALVDLMLIQYQKGIKWCRDEMENNPDAYYSFDREIERLEKEI